MINIIICCCCWYCVSYIHLILESSPGHRGSEHSAHVLQPCRQSSQTFSLFSASHWEFLQTLVQPSAGQPCVGIVLPTLAPVSRLLSRSLLTWLSAMSALSSASSSSCWSFRNFPRWTFACSSCWGERMNDPQLGRG